MKPYLEDKETVLAEAGSSMEGLSDEEAARRLERDGLNRLKEGEKESLFGKFLGELKDPMTIVLIIAAIVSAVTALYAGESLTDAVIILAVVIGLAWNYLDKQNEVPEWPGDPSHPIRL